MRGYDERLWMVNWATAQGRTRVGGTKRVVKAHPPPKCQYTIIEQFIHNLINNLIDYDMYLRLLTVT